MEDRLWGEYCNPIFISAITTTANPSGYPPYNSNFTYNTSDGGTAWVQEWMRISPGIDYQEVDRDWLGREILYFHWPNSYNEKYDHIVSTFERAKTIQDVFYINSLCGYYITTAFRSSYTPYTGNFTVNGRTYKGGDLGAGGMGGDFQTYNVAMNNRVYDYVLEQSNANTTGPMGIVMMDYIGTGNGGTNLPTLILQNNFKFPLKKDGNETTKSYNASYEQGGDAIGWK